MVTRCQQGRRWLAKQHDPITWTVLRGRLTTLSLLPSTNAGRCAVIAGAIVLLLLVLPWYAKGHKDKNGVVTYPNATFINPILAGIGATLLIYAAIRQAQTAGNRHEAQTETDRQRRITESFTKAVEQLAHQDIEVRLGGIYTLERISKESSDDYWTIMETLTAFVRERTRREAEPHEQRIKRRAYFLWQEAGRPDGQDEDFWADAVNREKAADIDAVLTVLKRRDPENIERERANNWRLDLRDAILKGYDLAGAPLEWAFLTGAHLEGADLRLARLRGAVFVGAHLERADLSSAVDLPETELLGAHGDDATKLPQRADPAGALDRAGPLKRRGTWRRSAPTCHNTTCAAGVVSFDRGRGRTVSRRPLRRD